MNAMSMLMGLFAVNQMTALSPNSAFGQGSQALGGGSGLDGFLGGATSGVGQPSSDGGGGGASKAVDIAKKYLGQKSGHISDLPNFDRSGGMDNNCADFVAACLTNAGVYKKKPGDASVRVLKQHLIEDGWKKVSKAQAKPGDVAIFNGTQHIELVATQGAGQLIGSNNKGGGNVQTVSMGSGNWGSVEYYSKG